MVQPMCQISHERKEVAGKTRFANNVYKAVCSKVSLTDTEVINQRGAKSVGETTMQEEHETRE